MQGLEQEKQASFDGYSEPLPQRARSSLHPSEHDLQVADDGEATPQLKVRRSQLVY